MAAPKRAKATVALLAALDHPQRREVLRAMDGAGAASPRELSEQLGKPLDNLSYHIRVLARCGAVKLVRTVRTRGSTQHFYRFAVKPRWARTVLEATRGETLGNGA